MCNEFYVRVVLNAPRDVIVAWHAGAGPQKSR